MATQKQIILTVEDEVPLLSALRDKFTREGFAVLEAKNGEEGLEVALREHPALILLDVLMPKMDGMTMLHKLRDDEWGKHVPVIILTNLTITSDQQIKELTETEPSYYLVKADQTLEDVVAKVREVLGE